MNFEGFSNACTINGLKIEAGIGSGEAYLSESDYTITKVHNNKYYITFLRDWEVILNYHGATEYRNPKLIIEIDGIGEVEMKAAGTSSFDINSETSSVIGDISMDGTVDQYDYSLYKEILDGDATYNNSNLDNKITEFNNYMSSIGYSSSSNEEKLYELIKIIALQ